MSLPAHYQQKKYPVHELTGLGIFILLLLYALVSKRISLDVVFDSLYLIAAIWLFYTEWNNTGVTSSPFASAEVRLFICFYLFIDAVLLSFMAISHPGILLIFYVALAIVYGRALLLRLKEWNLLILSLQWKNLLRYPAWLVTLGGGICLMCMYLPMVKYYMPFYHYSGPQYGFNIITGFGFNQPGVIYDFGSDITIKGYQVFLGHLVCLLLAFMLAFHIARTAGLKFKPALINVIKLFTVAIAVWWILAARGYSSLTRLANILFIAGLALLVLAFFFPGKAEVWFKKKDLVKYFI